MQRNDLIAFYFRCLVYLLRIKSLKAEVAFGSRKNILLIDEYRRDGHNQITARIAFDFVIEDIARYTVEICLQTGES